jgi:multicomponent Na+:H+ antiporter subunit B
VTLILVPVIFLFGFYIILNGHLSPGGGFSGGATIGAGLILYVTTFGFHKTQRFFSEKTYDRVKVGALSLYSVTMIYYFYTGANMLKNVIPMGTAGNILSSGMILPINIFVGLEVACTMYCFFALFRRGGM